MQFAAEVFLLDIDAKRLANLRARCALRGVQFNVTTDDNERPLHCAVKWAMTAHFSSLGDLAGWVGRVAGQSESGAPR